MRIQIWTCVYHKNEFDSECVVIRLFNAECGARHYYGILLFILNDSVYSNIYNYSILFMEKLKYQIVYNY